MVKPQNIISEQAIAALFGLSIRQFRELAKREHFTVAKISAKTRLYDMMDVVRVFNKYST